jgi:hypothetical protein
MARKRKQEITKLPPFVALPWEIMNSAAYISMKHSARAVLPYFLGKPKVPFNRPQYLQTDFQFSYPEACRSGFARSTFSKAIKTLVSHGFVDPVDKGGLRGHGKSCSRFKISRRWELYGKKAFIQISWEEFKPKDAV